MVAFEHPNLHHMRSAARKNFGANDSMMKARHLRARRDRCSSQGTKLSNNRERAIRQKLRGEPVLLTKAERQTLGELEPDRERYAAYLRSLPFTIDLGGYLVVHAGVRPGVSLDVQMASDMTEIRTMGADPSRRRGVPWYRVYQGPKTILFGHWPAKALRRGPHAIGLDTACVYGGRLTAFIIDTEEFVSVAARERYAKKR